jgi:hypothetical protein
MARLIRPNGASLREPLPLAKREKMMTNWIDGLAVSIAVVILLVVCVLLALAWHRLAAIQAQLDTLSNAVNSLELAHQGLLVRFMNLPRSRRIHKSSIPSSNTLEEKITAHTQPQEKSSRGSSLYVDAPKTFPE